MRFRPEAGGRGRGPRAVRVLALLLGALALVGVASTVSVSPAATTWVRGAADALPTTQNGSTGGDPSGSNAGTLCPSAGPVLLGVQWNCVAILNLTELALILASVGIVAYVFRDADRAELPGEATEVPVTAEEWETYRKARKLGIPYHPPDSPPREGEQ